MKKFSLLAVLLLTALLCACGVKQQATSLPDSAQDTQPEQPSEPQPETPKSAHEFETLLTLPLWSKTPEEFDAELTELGWTAYEDNIQNRTWYLGTFQGQPAVLSLYTGENSELVSCLSLWTRFYDEAGEDFYGAVRDGLDDGEWSAARYCVCYPEGQMSATMADWLLGARAVLEAAGAVRTEEDVILTGETPEEIRQILEQYLDDPEILGFEMGERWFNFPDGTLAGVTVDCSFPYPAEHPYFEARVEFYQEGYVGRLGDRPEKGGYAMNEDDAPFKIRTG